MKMGIRTVLYLEYLRYVGARHRLCTVRGLHSETAEASQSAETGTSNGGQQSGWMSCRYLHLQGTRAPGQSTAGRSGGGSLIGALPSPAARARRFDGGPPGLTG